MDPPNSVVYRANLDSFVNRLEAKLSLWRSALEPIRGAVLLGHHNEWAYFVDFAGVAMNDFLEPKPGIPPGPRHLEQLIESVKTKKVRAVVRATYNSSDASGLISERTGIPTIVLAQNVGELPETSDYISLVDYNVRQLAEGLR